MYFIALLSRDHRPLPWLHFCSELFPDRPLRPFGVLPIVSSDVRLHGYLEGNQSFVVLEYGTVYLTLVNAHPVHGSRGHVLRAHGHLQEDIML